MAGATLNFPVAAEGRHFVGHILLLRQLAERPGGGGGSEAMTKKKFNPFRVGGQVIISLYPPMRSGVIRIKPLRG